MANTYPLKPPAPKQFSDKSPSAVTNEAQAYKNMLGFQAAAEDVGLFYQLNQVASSATKTETFEPGDVRSRPIEANSQYA